ncbi:hypothetical protein H8356DRAFT_1365698 [Neocallimastix lanati (nom. inval.)]|nr:hypothetical protein H8356DRAFT_1365698 [Neocallimastix sp. JGI-2020a]
MTTEYIIANNTQEKIINPKIMIYLINLFISHSLLSELFTNKIINIFKYLNYIIDFKIIYDGIGDFITYSDAYFGVTNNITNYIMPQILVQKKLKNAGDHCRPVGTILPLWKCVTTSLFPLFLRRGAEIKNWEDNRTSCLPLSVSDRLSFDSMLYSFGVDVNLSLSKANMKDILYTPLYTTGSFSSDLSREEQFH